MSTAANSWAMRCYVQTHGSSLSLVIRMAILIWLVCGVVGGGGVVVVAVPMLSYRVQSLLGDKTLSPSPFPSLDAIALIAVGPEIGSHVPIPYTTAADNSVSHHAPERTELLDSHPSIVLDHCMNGNKSKMSY